MPISNRKDLSNPLLRSIFASNIHKNERPVVTYNDVVDDPDSVRKININEITADYQSTEVKEFLGITVEESRDLSRSAAGMENGFISGLKSFYDYVFSGREVSNFVQVVRVATVRDQFLPDIERDVTNESLKKSIINSHPEAFIDETVLNGNLKIPEKTPVYVSYVDNNKEKLMIVKIANNSIVSPVVPSGSTTTTTTGSSPTTTTVSAPTRRVEGSQGVLNPLGNVESTMTSPVGVPRPGHRHGGIDLVVASGTPVYSVKEGVVTNVLLNNATAGNAVYIKHEDVEDGKVYYSVYMHLKDAPMVQKDQEIDEAVQIGVVGSTGRSSGPHLHFEIRLDPRGTEYSDPITIISDISKIKPQGTASTNSYNAELERRGGDATKLPETSN